MIPINQSVVVTPLIYTHVTLYFISKAWLVEMLAGTMIFALEERRKIWFISELIGRISTF